MRIRNFVATLFVATLALTFGQPAYAQDPPVEQDQVAPVEADQAAPEQGQEPAPVETPVFEPEPELEPVTLGSAVATLTAAITAGDSHSVTVATAEEGLTVARVALGAAEAQQTAAMTGQAEVEAGVREAAQALVDHLRAAFGVE